MFRVRAFDVRVFSLRLFELRDSASIARGYPPFACTASVAERFGGLPGTRGVPSSLRGPFLPVYTAPHAAFSRHEPCRRGIAPVTSSVSGEYRDFWDVIGVRCTQFLLCGFRLRTLEPRTANTRTPNRHFEPNLEHELRSENPEV